MQAASPKELFVDSPRRVLRVAYADIPNMGDQLNPLILKKCFGYGCKCVGVSSNRAEICCIGSHLGEMTRNEDVGAPFVWGTGFIKDDVVVSSSALRLNLCAVRGALSKQKLESVFGHQLDIPMADPGLLASMLIDEPVEKRYKLGIIPHFREQADPRFRELAKISNNSLIIDVLSNPIVVISQIASCEIIISSSLHGLVIADAFGVPNLQIKVTDNPLGGGFKFDDYYSSYGLPPQVCDLNKESIPDIDEIVRRYAVSHDAVKRKQRQLIESFPFPVRKEAIADTKVNAVQATVRRHRSKHCCLSVIIPCHDVEKHVRRCLESILAALCRLDRPAEVICVDDGSTDRTVDEIKKNSVAFRKRGFRIVVLHQERQGAGVARNAGLSVAKGSFLHFCDADDWVDPDIYLRLVASAEKTGAEITTCTRRIVCDDNKSKVSGFVGPVNDLLRGGGKVVAPEDIADSVFNFATQVPWNKLFQHSFIKGNNLQFQALPRANDVYFVCMALAHAKRIALVDIPLYNYQISDHSVTRNDSLAGACGEAFVAVKDRLILDGLYNRFSGSFAVMVFTGFRFYFKMFSSGSALNQLYPSMRKKLLGLLSDGLGNSCLVHECYRAEYDIIRKERSVTALLLQYVREAMHTESLISHAKTRKQVQVQELISEINAKTLELFARLKRKDIAIAAKDAALEQLRGNIERQREAIAAKDAALGQLRGNIKRQREAIAAKDAALGQLRGNIERQREAISAKDAALGQLRGNIGRQREAIAAKDAALGQLRGNIKRQREAIAAKDAALEKLRGATTQLRGNVEKQREVIAAKDKMLAKQTAAIDSLSKDIVCKRRLLSQQQALINQVKGIIDA